MSLRQAAEMALEALENPGFAKPKGVTNAINVLRQALAQPEQKPAGWLVTGSAWDIFTDKAEAYRYALTINGEVEPVYTAPPSIEAAVMKEREACARVCDELQEHWLEQPAPKRPGYDCAKAIRARSEK